MIRRILALMYKEFLAVWRDKKSRFVLITPPLLQLFIYSFAATLDIKNVTIGILNWDKGGKGFELVEKFYHSKTFQHIVMLDTSKDINAYLDNEKVMAVLSIEDRFSANLSAQKKAQVQLILNGRRSNSAQIIQGYVSQIVERFSQEQNPQHKMQVTTITRNWFNPNLLYNWFTLPGLLSILTMLEALIIVSLSVAREKELGTFDQLLVSPLEPSEILLGKTLPAVVIAMVEGTAIIGAALLFFKLPFEGSFLLMELSMLVFVLAIIGFGLFLSALSQTQQQAVLSTFIFMTPAILLSGFAAPIENMPSWLQVITYANPTRYFMTLSRCLFMKNLSLEFVLNQIWPMAIIASIMLFSSTIFFRRKLI